MPFVGLDVHKKEIEAVVLDDAGNVIFSKRFRATRAALETFARFHLSKQHRVALEATTNTWAVVAILEPFVAEVVVSNPLRTRAIAFAKIKTDRVDALVLAQLLRAGYLPSVWAPDQETRRMRQRSSERANLTADRTRLKNRIHSVLHQRLIEPPVTELFGKLGLAWLADLQLDEDGRLALLALALDRHLRQLLQVEAELAFLDQQLAEHAYRNPKVKLLMTAPGFDFAVAETVLAVLGDITRFPDPDAPPPIWAWSLPPANPAIAAITAASPNRVRATAAGCSSKPPSRWRDIPGP